MLVSYLMKKYMIICHSVNDFQLVWLSMLNNQIIPLYIEMNIKNNKTESNLIKQTWTTNFNDSRPQKKGSHQIERRTWLWTFVAIKWSNWSCSYTICRSRIWSMRTENWGACIRSGSFIFLTTNRKKCPKCTLMGIFACFSSVCNKTRGFFITLNVVGSIKFG